MQTYKKLTLLIIVAICSFSIAEAQINIYAGYDQSKIANPNSKPLNGGHIGIGSATNINEFLNFEYALLYNYLSKSSTNFTIKTTTEAHRLDLPLRLAASFPIYEQVKLVLFGGPNINYSIMQKVDNSTPLLGGIQLGTGNIYKATDQTGKHYYQPIDLQMGFGAGIQTDILGVRFSYDLGLLNRSRITNNEWRNNDVKLSLLVSL